MSDDRNPDAEARLDDASPARAPEAAEAQTTIEELERVLAEERQKAAELASAIDGLHFKLQVLEKSYAKQLADARERAESAERQLAERLSEAAAQEQTQEAALQKLRADLERVTAERDRLRAQLGLPPDEPDASAIEGTINRLIADTSWARERPTISSGSYPQPGAEDESPSEELISPDLLFDPQDEGKA
ncbi:MAG TPA: hypothetical protein VF329_01215 [Gammaproteobacteria bacterium]